MGRTTLPAGGLVFGCASDLGSCSAVTSVRQHGTRVRMSRLLWSFFLVSPERGGGLLVCSRAYCGPALPSLEMAWCAELARYLLFILGGPVLIGLRLSVRLS